MQGDIFLDLCRLGLYIPIVSKVVVVTVGGGFGVVWLLCITSNWRVLWMFSFAVTAGLLSVDG